MDLSYFKANLSLALLATIALLCYGCVSDDDVSLVLEVEPDDIGWVNHYSDLSRGDTLKCLPQGFIVVENQGSSRITTDCVLDSIRSQCHYQYLTLSFHSPFESRATYLTLFLFGNRKLVANYSPVSSLEPEIFIHDFGNELNLVPQAPAFSVILEDGLFTVETTDTSNLFFSLPPAKFSLSKTEGITEWSDYLGNNFEPVE